MSVSRTSNKFLRELLGFTTRSRFSPENPLLVNNLIPPTSQYCFYPLHKSITTTPSCNTTCYHLRLAGLPLLHPNFHLSQLLLLRKKHSIKKMTGAANPVIAQDELFSAVQARCLSGAPTDRPSRAPEGGKKKEEKVKKEKPVWGEGKKKKEEAPKPAKEKFVNMTPEGEKKDLSKPMAASYEPDAVEASWDAWWAKKGYFTPNAKEAAGTHEENKFVMVIPPPNVTGSLHLGHAITTAIEDALTRWHRQSGKHTLWVPGTDHAGIATQSVVERILLKEENLTRHDLGREKFLEKVYAWKDKYGNRICSQFRRLGASVDWTREAFTMDDNLCLAVKHAFVNFHDQGLIYRDNRLINWCSHLRTALSDLEVDYEEIAKRTLKPLPGGEGLKVEVGVMCHFSYKVKGTDEKITVATTRLETMLGDTAVAVHPEDDRYKHLIGKELEHPFCPSRVMKVIADSYVDRELGTGCVKITPAHDHNDFQMGKRQNLDFINMLNDDGTVKKGLCSPEFEAKFGGKHRYLVRRDLETELKTLGLFVKKVDHAMSLGFCSRSGDIIEPLLKPQWWMNCKGLAQESVDAVRNGDLRILPNFHEATWFKWLDNIRDWCISRQLWWGHRIPAYRVVSPAPKEEDADQWFVALSEEDALAKASAKLGLPKDKIKLAQDEDVLDTWFSSGLFPFSVMGWPNESDDMKAFFPGQLLETGHDILFFWVARMVMMSLGLTKKLPFTTVYLHAMVRDKNGEKMSKSKGNVIDPLEVIDGATLEQLHEKVKGGNLPEAEVIKAVALQKKDFPSGIPECGADALRLGLLAYTAQGRNVNLDIDRVVGYRHFCNKLWNATRFALSHLAPSEIDGAYSYPGSMMPGLKLRLEDRWILSRLNYAATTMNKSFAEYQFSEAVSCIYNFWLHDLCDVYLELLKPRLYGESKEATPDTSSSEGAADRKVARDVLYTCLDQGLRLLHPMLPFVTEELYQRLPHNPNKYESICIASYPLGVRSWQDETSEKLMKEAKEIVGAFRSSQSALNIPNKAPPAFVVSTSSSSTSTNSTVKTADLSSPEVLSIIKTLAKVGSIQYVKQGTKEAETTLKGALLSLVNLEISIGLDVRDMVDLNAYIEKLQKQRKLAAASLEGTLKKTQAADYATKTPEEIQAKNEQQIKEKQTTIAEIDQQIASVEMAMKQK
ncbi:unnamed protein product [Amoebophrya sp. A25]|nr:unnamed protein product [Amoebophrya sp. A25]|eukprot:GSA25T00010092001.1